MTHNTQHLEQQPNNTFIAQISREYPQHPMILIVPSNNTHSATERPASPTAQLSRRPFKHKINMTPNSLLEPNMFAC